MILRTLQLWWGPATAPSYTYWTRWPGCCHPGERRWWLRCECRDGKRQMQIYFGIRHGDWLDVKGKGRELSKMTPCFWHRHLDDTIYLDGQAWGGAGLEKCRLCFGHIGFGICTSPVLVMFQFAYHLGNLLEVRFQFSRTGVRPEILYFFWFGSLKGNVIWKLRKKPLAIGNRFGDGFQKVHRKARGGRDMWGRKRLSYQAPNISHGYIKHLKSYLI